MFVPARQRLSPYEYFEIEAESPVKHEYLDGLVWAMAGGTPNHSAIATRMWGEAVSRVTHHAMRPIKSTAPVMAATAVRYDPKRARIACAVKDDRLDRSWP